VAGSVRENVGVLTEQSKNCPGCLFHGLSSQHTTDAGVTAKLLHVYFLESVSTAICTGDICELISKRHLSGISFGVRIVTVSVTEDLKIVMNTP
jgi:hypothetical protein